MPPPSASLPPLLPQNNANLTNLPPPPAITHYRHHRLLAPIIGATASLSVLLFFILLCHRLFRRRTPPSVDYPTESLRRFSYSSLRRATSSFSSSRRLGQGGFGAVYSGTLSDKKLKKRLDVAVKVMDSGSLQGEREFHNEILMANKLADSDYVVHLLGFASDRRRRMCLVYNLMASGNLQECLLHRKCEELMSWSRRRRIVIEVAKGLAYLHHQCDPPIIHGDVKPSNVLLDENFSAKIGDFGLARLKLVDQCEISINCGEDDLASLKNGNKKDELKIHVVEDTGSIVETESVITIGLEEASTGVDLSPENFARIPVVETSPEMFSALASPSEVLEIVEEPRPAKVKDYVMEWIGSEIDKERSADNSMGAASTSAATVVKPEQKKKSKDKKQRLDWWMAMDDDFSLNKGKRRPIREWWKEEYSEDLVKKSKKKRKKKIKQQGEMSDDHNNEDNWWPRDDEMMYVDSKMKSKRRKNSRGNLEWWLDGLSGDLWKARHNSCDSMSGEIPKSGGISSTPSMRGTVCYIAPEYSGGGDLSEKCDVYSFGVLLLVVIAGRRPLQVSGSPMSEYQSANLISWSRKLARMGKLLDLVDKKVESLNREEAEICIKVALLCLQKSPVRRPTMKDVVGMLTGELDAPCLPPELSPSRPSRFPYKSHKGPISSVLPGTCYLVSDVNIAINENYSACSVVLAFW